MKCLFATALGSLALLFAVGSQAQVAAPARPGSSYESPSASNSILRQRSWQEDFTPPRTYGFRNPGDVGRRSEYYPPGDRFQNERGSAPRVTARIGLGGVPDRYEQLYSQSVGTAQYNALQMHIDRYGSPRWGFGLWFGLGYPW